MSDYRKALRIRRITRFAVNLVIVVLALAPIAWGLSTSFKPAEDVLKLPPRLVPERVVGDHYSTLLEHGIAHYILNSAVVATATVLLCLLLGALSGYSLSRFAFRGRAFFMLIVITVMSIPLDSLIVPTYTLMANAGLLDTRIGLILLYSAYQLPIVIWLLYGYFLTIPRELDNAAMIDGYSRIEALWKVVLPLSGPGLVAAGLFVLVFAWNDFVVALVMTSSEAVRTLPVAVYNYLGFFGRDWGPLTAASMISIVPVIVIFILFQRYFISGMTGGGVKG